MFVTSLYLLDGRRTKVFQRRQLYSEDQNSCR